MELEGQHRPANLGEGPTVLLPSCVELDLYKTRDAASPGTARLRFRDLCHRLAELLEMSRGQQSLDTGTFPSFPFWETTPFPSKRDTRSISGSICWNAT